MNLLTDIINDVAQTMAVDLGEKDKLEIQTSALDHIMQRLSWIKHKKIAESGFPWLEKKS